MPIEILMPALSPTMKKGKVAKWKKAEGDFINPGDVLAEVETDKATMEVESVDSGLLSKILVPEGTDNVPVNTKIAILLEEGEEEDLVSLQSIPSIESESATVKAAVVESAAEVEQAPEFAQIDSNRGVCASPLARKIAKNMSIDLSKIRGSGPRGRIIKRDLPLDGEREHEIEQLDPILSTKVALTPMRRAIADKLSASKREIPHFYLSIDCNVSKLLSLRQEINLVSASRVSVNDFVVKAAALALEAVPEVNSSWQESAIVKNLNVDVCVAVGLDDGLITPIIFEANKKSLLSISQEVKSLSSLARERELKPHQYQGGTFTISNLGMYGIVDFSAIINPPQSAILAVGCAEKRLCKKDDEIVELDFMRVTLSCDHRVLDGSVASKWLWEFKSLLSSPIRLLI